MGALGECGEGCEEVAAVFGDCDEVTADSAELLGSGERPQTSGELLSQFDHSNSPFRGVIVEWGLRVGGEPQVVVLSSDQLAAQDVVFGRQLVARVPVTSTPSSAALR